MNPARRPILLILMLVSVHYSMGQKKEKGLTGQFYLDGIAETASGFKLNADSTFEFFFTYGAMDRFGSGKWTLRNDSIYLNSGPRPPKDFLLLDRKKTRNDVFTIRLTDENKALFPYVECRIFSDGRVVAIHPDERGIGRINVNKVDSISLMLPIYSNRSSVFSGHGGFTYYEFRFAPWIAEIFFTDFPLHASPDRLTGGHPLLQGSSFNYDRD